jgi:hypothetical protein
METAIVDVTLVRQPGDGKKYGSIKGSSDDWWPVKIDRIREFEAGNKYELAFTKSETGFKNIIGVKKIVAQPEPRGEFAEFREPQKQNGAAPAQAKPQAPQNGYYRPTAPRDSERMWTCAILGHIIDRGAVELNEEAMIHAVNLLRAVYQKTYGQDD